MVRSIANETAKLAGILPAGTYAVICKDVILEENVVSIFDSKLDKEIKGKEKANLTDKQIQQVENFAWADGTFKDGKAKPRFQNRTSFIFVEPNSGKSFDYDVRFWGGPGVNGKMAEFLEQATGMKKEEFVDKPFAQVLGLGTDRYTCFIDVDDRNFNHIQMDTIRKEGLQPYVKAEETQTENGTGAKSNEPLVDGTFTAYEKALVTYLKDNCDGKSIANVFDDIAKANVTVDGVSLGDNMSVITGAWNRIKPKVASYMNPDMTIHVVLK